MLLAIDVGNSNTSVGLFDQEKNLRFLAYLDTDSRIFSPVLTPGPTTIGGLPSRRVKAFSIMKFKGGTTLHKIAPVTSA